MARKMDFAALPPAAPPPATPAPRAVPEAPAVARGAAPRRANRRAVCCGGDDEEELEDVGADANGRGLAAAYWQGTLPTAAAASNVRGPTDAEHQAAAAHITKLYLEGRLEGFEILHPEAVFEGGSRRHTAGAAATGHGPTASSVLALPGVRHGGDDGGHAGGPTALAVPPQSTEELQRLYAELHRRMAHHMEEAQQEAEAEGRGGPSPTSGSGFEAHVPPSPMQSAGTAARLFGASPDRSGAGAAPATGSGTSPASGHAPPGPDASPIWSEPPEHLTWVKL